MAVLRSSQCESVPFEHDLHSMQLSRSLVETCTRFLAYMVDTQDYICQMKNTYVRELWPKLSAEIIASNSKVILLEKELAECREERDESRLYHMQESERLRMACEDERSHWTREIDSLRDLLGSKERCEMTVGFDRGLEGRLPNCATNFECRCKELEAQNQMQQRLIEVRNRCNSDLSTSHEDLKKQLEMRAEENEELRKELELASLKLQVVKQQRVLQEDSDNRYKRERRLSLKKQWHLESKSGSPLTPWKGEQGVEDGSLTALPPAQDSGRKQPMAYLETCIRGSRIYEISVPVTEAPDCTPAHIRHLAPEVKRIDFEANAAASLGKLGEHPTNAGHGSEKTVRLRSEKNAERKATVRVPRSLALKAEECNVVETRQCSPESDKEIRASSAEVADAERPEVECVSFAERQAEVPAKLIEPLKPFEADNAKQLCTPLSCNPGCNEDFTRNGGISRLAGVSRGIGELASSPGAKQCPSLDRGLKQGDETSISDKSKNLPKYHSGTKPRKAGMSSKERKWRDTRSRTEGDGADLHDSFLSTPRELAMANLKSRGQSDNIAQEDLRQSRSAELRQHPTKKGPSSIAVSSNRGKRETDNAAPYDWTDDELKDKQSVGPKPTAVKSTWSKDAAANTEKDFRPSSGARTSTDKEKHAPSSRAPGYRYNEPVRKKRDREQLEATDCLQCRKFYDAVLAEDAEGVTMDRCEHHDAASRHRYRCLPPGTPAGFWNIGFDSEF